MKKEHGIMAFVLALVAGGSTVYAKYDELLQMLAQDKINNAILTERQRVEDVEREVCRAQRGEIWAKVNECTPYRVACEITPECAGHFQ